MIKTASYMIAVWFVLFSEIGFAQPIENPGNKGSPPVPSDDEIVVRAERLPGSVSTDVLPLDVLSASDIAGYGTSSLSDLLDQISSKTNANGASHRQAPVLLVNGKRTSSTAGLAALPPEAILRVEIYPEKVAIEQGFSAGQRVVNIVLRKTFSATTAEIGAGGSVTNTFGNQSADVSIFQISGDSRINLSSRYARKLAVFAKERGVVTPIDIPLSLRGIVTGVGGREIDPALSAIAGEVVVMVEVPKSGRTLADFAAATTQIDHGLNDGRTITPASETVAINGSITRPVGNDANFSASFGASISTTKDILGLSSDTILVSPTTAILPFSQSVLLTKLFNAQPLSSQNRIKSANLGISFSGQLGEWNWSTDVKWAGSITTYQAGRGIDAVALQNIVDQGGYPFAADFDAPALSYNTTRYVSQFVAFETIVGGPLFALPAGSIRTLIQIGGDRERVSGLSFLDGRESSIALSRGRLAAAGTIEVPIASREKGFLSPIGDLSFVTRIANRRFSDAGDLPNRTLSLNWLPLERLSITSTWIGQSEAPTLSQLGAPPQPVPLRVIYDFVRGATVGATVVTGGNANLLPEHRRDFRLEVNWKPFAQAGLNLSALYSNIRASNSVVSVPLFTQAVESALPDRVVRDASGRIILIDQRDINTAEERSEQINWSLNYSKSFGSGAKSGNWSFNFSHRVRLRNQRIIREGLPSIDYLNGAAFSFRGGLPRHEIEAEGGWLLAGKGFRLSGSWRQGSKVIGEDLSVKSTGQRLNFSSLLTLNLRAFVDFKQPTKASHSNHILDGARLVLRVSNLLNNVVKVLDANQLTPIGYRPGYLDPYGRTIEVSLRKQF